MFGRQTLKTIKWRNKGYEAGYEAAIQLSSTHCLTFLSYSALFSEYNRAASLFAGLFGFGSHSNDWIEVRMAATS